MSRLTSLALALIATLGCSAAGADGLAVQAPLTLSPTPELEAATREAAEAWAKTTGIEIHVGPGGTPVRIEDELESCGRTLTRRRLTGELVRVDAIVIRRAVRQDCGRWTRTLRHELGHALMQHYSPDESPEGDGHADDGLMALHANSVSTIDEAALEVVCDAAPCAWMQVEGAQ